MAILNHRCWRRRPVSAGGWVVRWAGSGNARGHPAALRCVRHGAGGRRGKLRGRGGHGASCLPGHRRDAADARSPLQLHGSSDVRTAARTPRGSLLRPRDLDQRHQRQHHRDELVRGVPGVSSRYPSRRRHRPYCGGRRQEHEQRRGRPAAAWAQRERDRDFDPAYRIRRADRSNGRA